LMCKNMPNIKAGRSWRYLYSLGPLNSSPRSFLRAVVYSLVPDSLMAECNSNLEDR
jgi:hypothetical protein